MGRMGKLMDNLVKLDKEIIEMNQRLDLWFKLEELSEKLNKIKYED